MTAGREEKEGRRADSRTQGSVQGETGVGRCGGKREGKRQKCCGEGVKVGGSGEGFPTTCVSMKQFEWKHERLHWRGLGGQGSLGSQDRSVRIQYRVSEAKVTELG